MISRRAGAALARARPTVQIARASAPGAGHARFASVFKDDPSITDPNMNGGYVNPIPMKRSLRDPYGDWWDKQERRNFNEPVHEDNDILGVFSTEPYRHETPGRAGLQFLCFCAAAAGLVATVYQFYPDKPTIPRSFEGGLEEELGGPGAVRALKHGEEVDAAIIRD